MNTYKSPYKITNTMLIRISSIMKKIGKLDNYNNLNKMPILRKNNKIKSIHSSLAIEANSLSLNQVKDIINGKLVIGPEKEIQEVLNAYEAYECIKETNPYSIDDLKRVHEILTNKVVATPGKLRLGGEGIFDENNKCIFICPPASQVNNLMNKLFNWLELNKDDVHPLILSSIFHYEFVFIHPFGDGNGRLARLWQTILLSKWEPIFEYIPIENTIKEYQSEYYKAIDDSNKQGSSTIFIEFMLKMIDEILDELLTDVKKSIQYTDKYVKKILSVMEEEVPYTTHEVMNLLKMKSRVSFRDNYLLPAIEQGYIKMTHQDKPTSKNQTYYKL